jgi:hypothetical protein
MIPRMTGLMGRAARRFLLVALLIAGCSGSLEATPWLVEEGRPCAEIVIAETPPRLVALAARELRDYLKKITGAELPIVSKPGGQAVPIYVGRSRYTDELGVTAEGLAHGAFRMRSRVENAAGAENWLVLLGYDADFEPVEPWPRNHGDRSRAQAEWDKLTGSHWPNPMGSLYCDLHRSSGIWTWDEGGSLQAVYAFLRELGVRWYWPGELGEVVPQRASVALPALGRTVVPDFAYRSLRLGNVPGFSWEDFVHHLRLGLNDNSLAGSHGMREILGSPAMKEAHPEYYALYGGRRATDTRACHACFASEGLFRETLDYARARFDHLNLPAVSIFPEDGYRHCECERCADKTPSEAVWGFVERVARELYRTHPDRFVLGGAYTYYREPPESIEKFSPNVVVRISWIRPGLDDDGNWAEYWDLVERWRSKLAPDRLMRNANIQWSASRDFPVIHTRSIARDLGALHGIGIGEVSSVPRSPDQRWGAVGLSHLNVYVLAGYLWDASRDLDELLAEYYTLFYDPAAAQMRAAFEFAEDAYPRDGRPSPSRVDLKDRVRLVEMLHRAREVAGETIYGKRVQVIIDEFDPLETLRHRMEMAEARGDMIEFTRMHDMGGNSKWHDAAETFRLDGKLDEPFWTAYHWGAGLSETRTGRRPDHGTVFYLKWHKNALHVGIHCTEPDAENRNTATTKDDDPAIFNGDSVTVLLETDAHSYYEIAINPAGAVLDVDRESDNFGWDSQAEVATRIGDDYWTIEARIPISDHAEDPLHQVVGKMPTRSRPWHLNVCRQRVPKEAIERSAWSPTGSDTFRDKLKFGKLFERHSN